MSASATDRFQHAADEALHDAAFGSSLNHQIRLLRRLPKIF